VLRKRRKVSLTLMKKWNESNKQCSKCMAQLLAKLSNKPKLLSRQIKRKTKRSVELMNYIKCDLKQLKLSPILS